MVGDKLSCNGSMSHDDAIMQNLIIIDQTVPSLDHAMTPMAQAENIYEVCSTNFQHPYSQIYILSSVML